MSGLSHPAGKRQRQGWNLDNPVPNLSALSDICCHQVLELLCSAWGFGTHKRLKNQFFVFYKPLCFPLVIWKLSPAEKTKTKTRVSCQLSRGILKNVYFLFMCVNPISIFSSLLFFVAFFIIQVIPKCTFLSQDPNKLGIHNVNCERHLHCLSLAGRFHFLLQRSQLLTVWSESFKFFFQAFTYTHVAVV